MQRILVIAACSLVLWTLLPGVPEAAAQANTPERPERVSGDSLTLTLADARRRALAQNPAYLAERQDLEIARGQLTQARVYNFNPELEFEAPGAGTAGALGEYEASLTQQIEYGGQRGLRIDAARIGLERAQMSVGDEARTALAEASAAYYGALAAEQRFAVAEAVLTLNERLREATRVQLQEGEISVLEDNLAAIELGRARARVLTARRQLTSARLALKRRIGLAPEQEIRLVAEVPEAPSATALDQDSLVALALARRPDLAARTAAVAQYRALQSLARREALPELRVGVLAERAAAPSLAIGGNGDPLLRESLAGEPAIGFGVSVSLPVWNRNQGVRAQREAQADQAALRRAVTELEVRTEVMDAYRAYLAATEEAEVFERDVLRPALENQELLEIAYQTGKVDLASLILLRNQLLEAELGYWDAWLARREAWVDLESATATLRIPESAPTR